MNDADSFDAAYRELFSNLVAETRFDEVGLWLIVALVKDRFVIDDPVQVRRITIRLVKDLLEMNDIQAGCYNNQPSLYIKPWPLSNEQVAERINSEWDRLGHEPNIAEIFVFWAPN